MFETRRLCLSDRDEIEARRAAAAAEREAADRAAWEQRWNPREAAKRQRAAAMGPGSGPSKAEKRQRAEAQQRAARNRERLEELRASGAAERLAQLKEKQSQPAPPAPRRSLGARLRGMFD